MIRELPSQPMKKGTGSERPASFAVLCASPRGACPLFQRVAMARRTAEENWDEEDWDEENSDDSDSFDDETTVPCPYCKHAIHEDALRCPYCENYISAEDSPPVRKPWLIILGTVLAITAIYWWFIR
jgi:hypothetical protein